MRLLRGRHNPLTGRTFRHVRRGRFVRVMDEDGYVRVFCCVASTTDKARGLMFRTMTYRRADHGDGR